MWCVCQWVIAHGLVSECHFRKTACVRVCSHEGYMLISAKGREWKEGSTSLNQTTPFAITVLLEVCIENERSGLRQRKGEWGRGGMRRGETILYRNPRNAFLKTEAPYQGMLLSLVPTSYFILLFHQNKKKKVGRYAPASVHEHLFILTAYVRSMFK